MELYHHSQKRIFRNPGGAVCLGSRITLSLQVSGCSSQTSCLLILEKDGNQPAQLPMEQTFLPDGTCLYSVSVTVSQTPALYWYYFIISDSDVLLYYGNNMQMLGGEGQVYSHVPPGFQITVYKPASVPAWYRESIAYQIFPDRFARSADWMQRQQTADEGADWKGPCRVIQQNWYDAPYYTKNQEGYVTRWPFFGGTLQGIRNRLFYLKSMGVGTIYLNPIFSAFSNHKYDTANYFEIDPSFGTAEDFQQLASDARRLGIRLVLDGVFNHTGADSLYFNQMGNYPGPGACQGAQSPYYSWYRFSEFPYQYDCWWGIGSLPSVQKENPEFQDFIYKEKNSVIRHWLGKGASGFRLDVADELPDFFIEGIRRAVRETCPDGLLIGEVWEDASNKISYGVRRKYLLGEGLDAVMNYPLCDLLIDFMLGRTDAKQATRRLESLAENYPPQYFYSNLNLIGSHDRIRILTLMGEPPEHLSDLEKENYKLPASKLDLARQRLKVLSLFQFVLPGVPCVYYGDEAGVQGFEDPFNRASYPWGREDEDLLAHYRTLAAIRKQYSFLSSGFFRFHWHGQHILICERRNLSQKEAILVFINRHLFGNVAFDYSLNKETKYVLELLSSREIPIHNGKLCLDLPPLSAMLLYCSEKLPPKPKIPVGAGVLLSISSLPSGKMDENAESFIDYLSDSGQKLWQILPLNPTDKHHSPYASPAVFAGNMDLLEGQQDFYQSQFESFCLKEAFWLDDFALYTMLKQQFDNLPWQKWPKEERDRKNLDFWKTEKKSDLIKIKKQQFLFWQRWRQIKDYANKKGISIIGDLPLYVNADSADTWAHRELFFLSETGIPLAGSGVPPDSFSQKGQSWGNPLYDWDALKKTGYKWWEERVSRAINNFDYVRLDHFRGFSAFYSIPKGNTAESGWWLPGPGKDFFDVLSDKLGPLPFIAEDLGMLDQQVENLLKLTGFPGTLVYQFTPEELEAYQEDMVPPKIVYTGTHDNQPLAAWCRKKTIPDTSVNAIIKKIYQSAAPWVIVPLQDLLGLGDESRMNTPGQAEGNWSWRMEKEQLSPQLSERMRRLSMECHRYF